MKATYFISFMLAALLAFTSCKKEAQLQKVQQLEAVLDSAELVLQNTDTSGIQKITKEMKQELSFIVNEFKDTLSLKDGILLSDYKKIKKSLGKHKKQYLEQRKELRFARSQLENLSKDIREGIVQEKNFEMYFESESLAVHQIKSSIQNMDKNKDFLFQRFQTYQPRVETFIDSVKQYSL